MERIEAAKPKVHWTQRSLQTYIRDLMGDIIFNPLIEDIKEYKDMFRKDNSRDPQSIIKEAIRNGKIFYQYGKFSGEFDATLSKALYDLGAKKDGRDFVLLALPTALALYVSYKQANDLSLKHQLLRTVEQIPQKHVDVMRSVDLVGFAETTYDDIYFEFDRTIPDWDKVSHLSEGTLNDINKRYVQNLEMSISKWSQTETERLKSLISESIQSGESKQDLVKKIKGRFSVSTERAKFLAQSETKLYISSVKELQYPLAGYAGYIWTNVGTNVRPHHKELNGKYFRWDSPPVMNVDTQARGHPSMDYGCKCIAIPVKS